MKMDITSSSFKQNKTSTQLRHIYIAQHRIMPKPKRNINAVAEATLMPPDLLAPHHLIAKLKQAAGKNLYYLDTAAGATLLAELNQKFRSTIWLRRGSYVVVDTASLADRDNKLGGEIVNVVGDEKAWRKMSYWPAEFAKKTSSYAEDSNDEGPQMPPSNDEEEEKER
ncbi:hypothetical protein LTR35_005704 [Friedmanniomyces endolithicus]|nr:hypothetical protein LTS09_011699 [Friedmanniomyces endolithicus]KAK0284790.1 hypothetical protein LTR35_005704 [Friedmanniomyces endolithicus]KAK0297731.1 hypothetical protein LTS00_003864 [Friedmanniomyces endolithicus]KAK0320532.1 hypothetical protein LTR82_008647 [Friedmanniomyces endolithicus]KAK1009136.1 hypothetical protein LTR54_005937 [Friedmanniomyces endolithicus]